MHCEDAVERIHMARSRSGTDLRAAMDHAADCTDCHAALRALDAIRPLRDEPVPVQRDEAIERAIDKALATNPARRYRRGLLTGIASGAALAATIAAAAIGIWFATSGGDLPAAVPAVHLALNQPRAVIVTLESPEPLANAEVRVELRGAVELDGYAGQRELRWSTDLAQGINQLTLPVVALDATGGQVLVEVMHGDKRRAFVLDVRAAAG
jgi:hypothetical protein